jgi:hypothetical protein
MKGITCTQMKDITCTQMKGITIKMIVPKSKDPELSAKFVPLHTLLQAKFDYWVSKQGGKTYTAVMQMLTTLNQIQLFAHQDDPKTACFLWMKRSNSFNVKTLKQAFYRDKKGYKNALKEYKTLVLVMIEWIKSSEGKFDQPNKDE